MESRIAVVGIIVENPESTEKINGILHEYSKYIIGRMGIPHPRRDLSVISVVIDGPANVISAMSGKLGMIKDVSIKTVYAKTESSEC